MCAQPAKVMVPEAPRLHVAFALGIQVYKQGLEHRDPSIQIIQIVESQMEKNMQHETETGVT